MLKVRVIPTLLWKGLGLVKGVSFDSWRRVGTVLPSIKVYNTRQVDELIVVDVSATIEGRAPDFDEISGFSSECFVPLTVGGGVKSLDDIKNLLRSGADKVCINSAAYNNPEFIRESAGRFGSQCIVVSIDVRCRDDGHYECYSHSGTLATGRDPASWARLAEQMGAGELLVTSVERDGAMTGYALDLIKLVANNVTIPVIASGGAGNYQHLYEAVAIGGASAVAAASIFHFTEQTPMEAKKYLAVRGVPVRNVNILLNGKSPAS